MYLSLYGLERNPFKNAPGSTCFYTGVNHQKILEVLIRGMRQRFGLHLILGDNGTGKTTLCNFVQLAYNHEFTMGYVGNPFVGEDEFLRTICSEFGVETAADASTKDAMDALAGWLEGKYREGRIVVLFLDEAHHLDRAIFDQLLVMANLQTSGVAHIQIVMAGLPVLLDVLGQTRLSSLNQRIGSRFFLSPLSQEETASYIAYRLKTAGAQDEELFSRGAAKAVWKQTGGKIRLVNHLCRLSLEKGAMDGAMRIDQALVKSVLADPLYAPLFNPQDSAAGRKRKESAASLWTGALKFARNGFAVLFFCALFSGAGFVGVGLYKGDIRLPFRIVSNEPAVVTGETAPEQSRQAEKPARKKDVRIANPSRSDEDGGREVVVRMKAEGFETSFADEKPQKQPDPYAPQQDFAPTPEMEQQAEALAREVLAESDVDEEPVEQQAPDVAVKQEQAAGQEEVPAEPEEKTSYDDIFSPLPGHLQDIRINAIAWDEEPEKSMVVVNNAILHEGDRIMDGTLVHIAVDHIIIKEGAERFLIKMPERN